MADGALTYIPSPTFDRFHQIDDAIFKGVLGPVGSGKTVGCFMELVRLASLQVKQSYGWRKARAVVIRNTYPELVSTSLATFTDWFGEYASVKKGAPIEATLTLPEQKIELQCWFVALDREDHLRKLKSLEVTFAFMNEASELRESVLRMARSRVGRYPKKQSGGARFPQVIADTNPPDDEHWWYRLAEVEQPRGFVFLKQPGGLMPMGKRADGTTIYVPNPDAENIGNLPGGYDYYMRQLPGNADQWIRVMLCGEYGSLGHMRPVYSEYRDEWHCSPTPIEPMPGLPLLLGMDFGLTPACAIAQLSPLGQMRILDEVVTTHDDHGIGLARFLDERLTPHLAQHYPGMRAVGWGDPAGNIRSQADELTCYDVLQKRGFQVIPAPVPNNALEPRLQSVRDFLGRAVECGPGLLLDKKAEYVRKGMRGGYYYEQVLSGDGGYREKPAKTIFSHVHDGLQYLCLGAAGSDARQSTRIVTSRRKAAVASAGRSRSFVY